MIDVFVTNSHNNNVAMTSILNDFPTDDEVNEALDEIKNSMVNADNLYTKEEANNEYSIKSIVYDLEQYIKENYISNDQMQSNYYE